MLVERTLSHNTCMTNVFQLRTLFPDYAVAIGTVDLMTNSGWEPKFGSRGHFEMVRGAFNDAPPTRLGEPARPLRALGVRRASSPLICASLPTAQNGGGERS